MVDLDLSYLRKYITVEKIILFGSAVTCPPEKANDIDLIVVSDSFIGVSNYKRREITKRCIARDKIDPICLTVEEYQKMLEYPSEFSISVMKNHIEL